MDLDRILISIEERAREFILYLLSFFRKEDDIDRDPLDDLQNKAIIFSIVAALLGSYLVARYLYPAASTTAGIYDYAAQEILFWISMTVFAYALLHLLGARVKMMAVASVVFSVFPVAFVLACYAVYLTYHIASYLSLFAPPIVASAGGSIVEYVFLAIYLPRRIVVLTPENKWRGHLTYLIILIVMLLLILSRFAQYGHERAYPSPSTTTASGGKQ